MLANTHCASTGRLSGDLVAGPVAVNIGSDHSLRRLPLKRLHCSSGSNKIPCKSFQICPIMFSRLRHIFADTFSCVLQVWSVKAQIIDSRCKCSVPGGVAARELWAIQSLVGLVRRLWHAGRDHCIARLQAQLLDDDLGMSLVGFVSDAALAPAKVLLRT